MQKKTSGASASINPLSSGQSDSAYFGQLKARLRWQLLTAYALPLLLLALYFHYHYTATLRQGIDNQLKSTAENQRNTVDLFLQERVSNLKSIFRTDVMHIPPPGQEMENAFADLKHESSTFVDLGLFDPQGRLVSYQGPHTQLVGKDYSSEAWFGEIQSSERNYIISDVYLGFRGKPHFIIAVKRTAGGRSWVLRASVDPEKFGQFVKSSYLVEDAEAFIINSQGTRQTLSGTDDMPDENRPPPVRTPETQIVEMKVSDRHYLKAITWLTENNWAMVVRIETDKAFAPIRKARIVSVGIVIIALILIVLFVFRNTNSLVHKLEQATEAKQHLQHQLFNAAKLASVGEMAAGVAHEINNPLAIIYEEASMMKDIINPQFNREIKMDDIRERMEAIIEATMRGRTITRKLLAFARPHEPDPEPTNMNLLISRILESREMDFKVSNIEVETDFTDDLAVAMVNPNQMDQVMLNLLNNAKDAFDGPGKVVVRSRINDGMVEIEVEDNGRGMPPDVMEKIFFPFFTTKSVGKGTGLGLSISYGIIKTLGGNMDVKSRPGEGTTFIIRLPMQKTPPCGERQLPGADENDE